MSKPAYRRTRPFAAYLLLLILTTSAYLLYESFVVPLIQINEITEGPEIESGNYSTIAEDTEHHRWFEHDSWERQPCAILRTAHGKILFSDFKVEDPKTWLVFPFSIVLDREPDPENPTEALPPIVLRCEKGARLKFDQPVSASIGTSNYSLRSAQLEGSVELFRRKNFNSNDEDLRIETSNILIDNNQIVTIDDVAFWFGTNTGIGRNLTIELSHNDRNNKVSHGISAINGLTSVRLGFLSSMRLQPTRNDTAPNDRMLSNDNSAIEVTTAGPFEFDFLSNVARFRDQVQVRKLDRHGDTLRCDELLLKFKSSGQTKAMPLDAATDNEFELQSILAKGTPATLESNSQRARVTGQLLQYDLDSQMVTVTDPNQVQISKDENQFIAKSIQYQLMADQTLGPLDATGPGQLTRFGGNNNFTANWAKTLTLNRISDQQHRIQLTGQVQLQLDADTSLTADQIDFSIWEVPVFGQNNEFVRWTYQPDRLIATRDVHVSSEKLIADAQKLNATWPANPTAAQQLTNPVGQSSQRDLRSPVHVAHNHVNPPPQIVRRVAYQQPGLRPLPIMVTGNEINVVVDNRTGEHEIADLRIAGDVHVNKPSARNPEKPELEISGESLRMIPQGNDRFQVQVASAKQKTAEIISEKIRLTGKRIFLDQEKNSMWIEGKGNVKLNNNSNPILTKDVQQSNRIIKSNQLDVSFSGGMIFDGTSIYFERNVSANVLQTSNGINSLTQASGTALRIQLDRRIAFTELERDSSAIANPQITEMVFQESLPAGETQFKLAKSGISNPSPVSITNQKTDFSNKVIEKFTLRSPRAVMNQSENELLAYGPGSIQIFRRGSNGKQARGFGFVGDRTAPADPNGLTYIHTKFDQQLVANTVTNEITISGNLRSIYAPTTSFDQSFDPDRNVSLPNGAVRLNCQQIQLSQSNNLISPKPSSQFIASGNAHIYTDTVESTADRISYQEDSDMLLMESTTNKKVLLKVRSDARSPWNNQVAGARFSYSLKDKAARVDNVDHISATIQKAP